MKLIIIALVSIMGGFNNINLNASSALEDLKDDGSETEESIAKPNCLIFQQECKGYPLDFKRYDAYKHCLAKRIKNHCRETFGRPTQVGLFHSCMNTPCGQKLSVKKKLTEAELAAKRLKQSAKAAPSQLTTPVPIVKRKVQTTTAVTPVNQIVDKVTQITTEQVVKEPKPTEVINIEKGAQGSVVQKDVTKLPV